MLKLIEIKKDRYITKIRSILKEIFLSLNSVLLNLIKIKDKKKGMNTNRIINKFVIMVFMVSDIKAESVMFLYRLKTEYDKTIITITHNLEEAVFADRVMVLNEGQIVLDGTPQEVLKQKDILEQSGLKLIDSLALIDELKDINFNNKEKVLEKLWELTFKM